MFAEAGGTHYYLLRKGLVGHRVVDEHISRPQHYPEGDCVIYEQLNAQEIRVVCGEGRPRTLVAEGNRFGGEMTGDWDIREDGLRRLGRGTESAKCIPLATARRVAEGGAVVVVVETCAAEPATRAPGDGGQ